MFTVKQAAQVKQIFVQKYGRFVTDTELQALYEADYAGYLATCDQQSYESYDDYFGDLFNDPWGTESFLDLIEFTLFENQQ